MTPLTRRGLVLALCHVAIVASLGVKLEIDRATRPRVWARAMPFDPNLPIRGRYVSLTLEVATDAVPAAGDGVSLFPVALVARNGALVAVPAADSSHVHVRSTTTRAGARATVLAEPVAYFIPEHVADPSRRPPGEELWAEVTIPRSGAPRPIRLGVRKDGVLTPLALN
jgi:hypothetical protein